MLSYKPSVFQLTRQVWLQSMWHLQSYRIHSAPNKEAVSFFCGNCSKLRGESFGSFTDCTQILGIDTLNINQPFPIYVFARQTDIESLH